MPAGGGTVSKSLDVLDRVAAFGHPVRFNDLLAESPYPKGTLYRLLQELVVNGLLSRDPETGQYELGARLVRLAHSAWRQASLAPRAHRHLVELSHETGEVVHLAQLESGQVLYLDKVSASPRVEMFSAIGRVGPAYCTGVGKVMLAFLPEDNLEHHLSLQSFHRFTTATLEATELRAQLKEIRADGVAWDREEHEMGIVCCAAPIRTSTGRLLGGLSVTSTTQRKGLHGLEEQRNRIAETACMIGREAETWRFPEHDGTTAVEQGP